MSIALRPSTVTTPDTSNPVCKKFRLMIDFLADRFPQIPLQTWSQRLASGKIYNNQGFIYTPDAPFEPGMTIHYFRETDIEPIIPFQESILFCDDHIMVVYKPHFIPVIPAGRFINESLLNRLIKTTGMTDLSPIHRIDRLTAGLVLFSTNKNTRGLYQKRFMDGLVEKTYDAYTAIADHADISQNRFTIENRLVPGNPWFTMAVEKGPVNAGTRVELVDIQNQTAHFILMPITGKKHQLRIHLSQCGFNILNDRLYPTLLPEAQDDYENPLRLYANCLRFKDPITGKGRDFSVK